MGVSTRNHPARTVNFFKFDETFRICRAFFADLFGSSIRSLLFINISLWISMMEILFGINVLNQSLFWCKISGWLPRSIVTDSVYDAVYILYTLLIRPYFSVLHVTVLRSYMSVIVYVEIRRSYTERLHS
jgi:hypothetical protein